MYNLANTVTDARDVPKSWIYKHYLKLLGIDEELVFDGRLIKLHSPWTEDSTASFFLFPKDGQYLWKDFSNGWGGNVYALVQKVLNRPVSKMFEHIWNEYYNFIQTGGEKYKEVIVKKVKKEYEVTPVAWNQTNSFFWRDYKITTKTLNTYGVIPIQSYTYKENGEFKFTNWRSSMYGYYSRNGLYKLYMPGGKPKYITVDSKYICGFEQLTYTKDILLIQSGLKDMLAMHELDLSLDKIAGNSETTMISEDLIFHLKSKYSQIFTMFDNDTAGKSMGMAYKRSYDIEPIFTNLNKDVADDLKNIDGSELRLLYTKLINNKIVR